MSAGSDDSTLLTPRNLGAFLLVSVIWGGTWLVIKDQLGNVPAQWSITYRFVVACLGMFALAKLRGESLALAKGGSVGRCCWASRSSRSTSPSSIMRNTSSHPASSP